MPGLSQLQKLNADLLSLGDEEKIRALRGEKPVTYKIPRSVPDKDDSDDFKFGMPEITEEDLAQSEAAEAERLREANDFSDITGESKTETAAQPKKVEKEVAPDFSELLPSAADLSADDLDLSDFETPEEEVPEEPEEVAIEDMDRF